MFRKLSTQEARAAFEELAKELPKQHLRLPFRRRFGTGELLSADMMKRGTSVAAHEKPVTNLLQEIPENIKILRLTGTAEAPEGQAWSLAAANVPVGKLLADAEVEQLLIVTGHKAKLYIYSDPTEEAVYSFRIAIEPPAEPKKAPTPGKRPTAGKKALPKARTAGKARARR